MVVGAPLLGLAWVAAPSEVAWGGNGRYGGAGGTGRWEPKAVGWGGGGRQQVRRVGGRQVRAPVWFGRASARQSQGCLHTSDHGVLVHQLACWLGAVWCWVVLGWVACGPSFGRVGL